MSMILLLVLLTRASPVDLGVLVAISYLVVVLAEHSYTIEDWRGKTC
jgi:hypothetical protein